MMTIEEIKSTAPAIFATKPSPKMSDKYVFVPTMDILDNFQKQGWELSSVKQTGLGVYGVHELRLRNGGLPKVGDCLVEAIIRNSHNGIATFSVSAGLHRLVCSNGLTVPTSLSESFNLRHQRFDLDEVKQLTESFAERLPIIQSSVDRMMTKVLTTPEKIQFVKQAINTRWKTGTVPATLDVMAIMYPKREEDNKNDLWTVFNVVQENFIRGGLEYTSSRGRKTSSKGLKSIMAVNQVNTKLWDLAEQFSY
jgi:hypothetical protein